jgi:hypothetical protein
MFGGGEVRRGSVRRDECQSTIRTVTIISLNIITYAIQDDPWHTFHRPSTQSHFEECGQEL